MVRKNRIWAFIILVFASVYLFSHGLDRYREWKVDHSGIPDAVSSMRFNNDEHLTVVANSDSIKDKETFAREIIHMCQSNSFHSILFSSFPSRLEISVYLKRRDIGEKEPVCRIKYAPLEYNDSYDIRNNAEQFHLYLDGQEIEYY